MESKVGQTMGDRSSTEPNGKAATGGAHPNDSYVFTPDERNAMRAYLQRSEVRLSTIHRVACGFLGGAGLLFLFPVFLKDGVLSLITTILAYAPTMPANLQSFGTVGVVAIYICMLFPFLLSLALPVLALLLLLEDIMRFYFVSHPPTFSEELFNPRFVLTGIAFSPDESPEVKERVMRHEYGTDLIGFVVSRAEAHSRYYSNIIDKPKRHIVPTTRKLPRLIRSGVVKLNGGKSIDQLADSDTVRVNGVYSNGSGSVEQGVLDTPFVERTVDEIDRFNAALGLTGFIERPLYQEVAKTEVSLVRHALKLRRLVLRYFQALLILIWTSFITFLMLPFLHDTTGRFPMPMVFAVAYIIWAIFAPWVVNLPLEWLVGHTENNVRRDAIKRFQQLDALQTFGKQTQRLCYAVVAVSLIGLVLEMMLRV